MNKAWNLLPPEIFVWGSIGQVKLTRPIIEHYGSKLVVVFDDAPARPAPFDDIPMYYGWETFLKWIESRNISDLGFCLSINAPRGRDRLAMHDQLVEMGITPATLVHPSAVISPDAVIGPGSQIMAGAIIGPAARIGKSCILNTNSSVDHDNVIGDGSEIAPGCTLCGVVTLGENVFIGAGATVIPGISIGQDAVVGAGAVVNKAVYERTTVVGIPAKPLQGKV